MKSRSSSSATRYPSILAGAALAVLALGLAAGCGKAAKEPGQAPGTVALATVDQKVSYGVGYNFGSGLARQGGLKVDQDAIRAGIEDGLAGAKTRIAESELQAAFTALHQQTTADQEKAAVGNLAAATAFLEKNQARADVKTTASGLQYEVLTSGKGAKPTPTNTVEVHYHGTLIDGTVFDSSVQRGETIQFPVTGVIPGWVEALQLMSVGDKWKLFIAPTLGYGPRASGKIPPNSALIFEVELISIK